MIYAGSNDPLYYFYYLLASAGSLWRAFIPARSRFHPNYRKEQGLGKQVSSSQPVHQDQNEVETSRSRRVLQPFCGAHSTIVRQLIHLSNPFSLVGQKAGEKNQSCILGFLG
jgi:hypothetical protein